MAICHEYLHLWRVGGGADDGAADWFARVGVGVYAMSDLVERLRGIYGHEPTLIDLEAANRIEALEAALRGMVTYTRIFLEDVEEHEPAKIALANARRALEGKHE